MTAWGIRTIEGWRASRRRVGMIATVLGVALIVQCSALLLVPFVHVDAAQQTLTGTLGVLFADPAVGATLPVRDTRYFLSSGNGPATEVLLDSSATQHFGGPAALIGETLIATVSVPVGPLVAANVPRTVTAIALAPGVSSRAKSRATASGDEPFLNILCKFPDVTREPEPLSYFNTTNGLMSDLPGTVGAYWNEISYNQINVHGSQSVGWYTLPKPEASYATNGTLDYTQFATDCATLAVKAGVNLDAYKGIGYLFNDNVVGYSLGGQAFLTVNGTTTLRAQMWLMPWAYHIEPGFAGGPALMEHEMGHAFLLWHSGNNAGVEYKDSWDVMGDSYFGCPSPTAQPYGCPGQSVTSYDKDYLGWIPANRKLTYGAVTRKITLTSLLGGTAGNYLIASIPHTNTTDFTDVEMRFRTGLDSRLPGDGVIIHEIDTTNDTIVKKVQSSNGNADAIRAVGQAYPVPDTAVTVTVQSVNANTAIIVISSGVSPSITNASTLTGPANTGNTITLTGTNLSPEATVTFGTAPATNVTSDGNGALTMTTPALAVGSYTVTVTNPDGRNAALGQQYVTKPVPVVQPGSHPVTATAGAQPSQPGAHPVAATAGAQPLQPGVHPTVVPTATPAPQPNRR